MHDFRIRRGTAVALGALLVGALGPAVAEANTTADLSVLATVPETCSVEGGTLDFDEYDSSAATPTTGTGEFTITCGSTTTLQISLGAGNNPNENGSMRRMSGPSGSTLGYLLLQQEGGVTWGDGGALGGKKIDVVVSGGTPSIQTVHGVIQAGLVRTPGGYSDIVTITIEP